MSEWIRLTALNVTVFLKYFLQGFSCVPASHKVFEISYKICENIDNAYLLKLHWNQSAQNHSRISKLKAVETVTKEMVLPFILCQLLCEIDVFWLTGKPSPIWRALAISIQRFIAIGTLSSLSLLWAYLLYLSINLFIYIFSFWVIDSICHWVVIMK